MKCLTAAVIAVLEVCSTTSAIAQAASHPAVDSANVARAAVRDASRAGTPASRVALLTRAARAWPSQPAYWQMLQRAAAEAGDSIAHTQASAALEQLDVGVQTLKPRGARVVHMLPDSMAFVEGIVHDAASHTLLVSEMRRGTVFRLRADKANASPIDLRLDTIPGMGAVWATRSTRNGRDLMVASASAPVHTAARANAPGASRVTAAVWWLDARSGAVKSRIVLPDSLAGHAPGDLLQLKDGTIVVSDASTAALYVLPRGAGEFITITHPLLRSPQGVVEAAHGVLVVADYSHGLLRVNVTERRVDRLADAPHTTVLGLDGLAWYRGRIAAVQNGLSTPRVVLIQLDKQHTHVVKVTTVWRDTAQLVSPTTLAADDEGLWLFANTQWDNYDERGARHPDRPLRPAVIVHLPWRYVDTNSAVPPVRKIGTMSSALVPPSAAVRNSRVPRSPYR